MRLLGIATRARGDLAASGHCGRAQAYHVAHISHSRIARSGHLRIRAHAGRGI